jgi:hypothetical protein
MTISRAVASLAALCVVMVPVSAQAATTTPAADFQLDMASQTPATPTSLNLHILFKDPNDPEGQPPPQRKIVIEAPEGSIIDSGAVPQCLASDSELELAGQGACSSESVVGTGTLSLITGGGPLFDPFVDGVTLFNGNKELIEDFYKEDTNVYFAVGRRQVTAPNTYSETPGSVPGSPANGHGGESSARSIDYRIADARGPTGRAYITTPPSCPSSGEWTSRLTFTTSEPKTYTVTSQTPCVSKPQTAAGQHTSSRPSASGRKGKRHARPKHRRHHRRSGHA